MSARGRGRGGAASSSSSLKSGASLGPPGSRHSSSSAGHLHTGAEELKRLWVCVSPAGARRSPCRIQMCKRCHQVITTGGVTYKNEPWHRECFCCAHCAQSLAGQRFTSKEDRPYCAQCYGDLFAKRCATCSQPITGIGGTKFISFEDRHWHNECFACAQCRSTLVGKGFITDGPDILCPDCAKARLMAANA